MPFFSLLIFTGNVAKSRVDAALNDDLVGSSGSISQFSLYFSLLVGNLGWSRFDPDCLLSQPVVIPP
jgi:hypothetical protein